MYDAKKNATEHHVAPDCEISDGKPVAGRHMNTAVVPYVADRFRLSGLRCGYTWG